MLAFPEGAVKKVVKYIIGVGKLRNMLKKFVEGGVMKGRQA